MDAVVRILSIAAGGAVGAVLRHLINISPLSGLFGKFPLPTLIINVAGSFAAGFFLILLADKIEVHENVRLAVLVGLLGAFTTFSTFELEIFGLIQERHLFTALVYFALSVGTGFIGVVAGTQLGRSF
jgi:CrcB protein